MRRAADSTPPWLLPGLPVGLTPVHFAVAATVWMSHLRQRVGDEELRPLLGDGGAYFRLAGMDYANNAGRIAALARVPPLGRVTGLPRMPDGPAALHPVILVPDPTVTERGETPVGVCGVTGYIGSAWNAHRSVAAQVYSLRPGGRLLVTVAGLAFDEHGAPSGTVWLPTPDTPQ